jgi:hypothetical protein
MKGMILAWGREVCQKTGGFALSVSVFLFLALCLRHIDPVMQSEYSLTANVGAWRSLVARLLWVQEVGGSNPSAPTMIESR